MICILHGDCWVLTPSHNGPLGYANMVWTPCPNAGGG